MYVELYRRLLNYVAAQTLIKTYASQGGQVIRAYIYEALAIISAAVLTGSVIGLLIAITLTLQFNLFTEMPFVFTFP